MYYGLVVVAVVMFGLQFLANKQYQKQTGSGVFQAMLFNLLGCTLGLPVLLLALAVLPASVNYPMVTGGTMTVSTVLAYFTVQKPKKKEWLAVFYRWSVFFS